MMGCMNDFLEKMNRTYTPKGGGGSNLRLGLNGETRGPVTPKQTEEWIFSQAGLAGNNFDRILGVWSPSQADIDAKGD